MTTRADDHAAGASAKTLLLGVVYFVASVVALKLSHGPYGFAPFWPSNAILLAAILRGRGRPYLAIAAVMSLAANRWAGGGWLVCTGFTVANLLEPLIARALLRRAFPGTVLSNSSGQALIRFCAIAALSAAVSAVLATAFAPGAYRSFFTSWFLADFLGMLIITPILTVGVAALRGGWLRVARPSRTQAIEAALLLAMVTVVTLATFVQSSYPLLFLPLAAMLAAVVRLGTVGASVSVLVIAVIASVATALGTGPVMILQAGRLEEVLFLQGYLLVLYAAALPTAALLNAQRQLVQELRENNRLLNLAEAAARLGHWRLGVEDGGLYWSAETFRIHGWDPAGVPPTLDEAIDAYVEDDRDLVRSFLDLALADGRPYEYRARIRRPDGEIRHLLSRGEIDRAADGSVAAVFGMVQDVTEQSEQESALDRARIVAEESAAAARLASETDALTDLPNRRQLLLVLDRARGQADALGQPLSVAILDIDQFKRVNDTFGHGIGDRVLQRIARTASSALRSSDLLGRFGGEEFVIVLPNTSLDVAETIADRVRAVIEADVIEGLGEWPGVTASLGVAAWRDSEAISALLQRADEALYDAKRGGRNLVCTARPRLDAALTGESPGRVPPVSPAPLRKA